MATTKKQVDAKCGAANAQTDDDFTLHMLRDKKTEMYIKFAKIMVIFQGSYPDSRYRELERVRKTFKNASQVITDETYCQYRNTTCSYTLTEEYYHFFQTEVQKALSEGNNLVVIDPTMSSLRQNQYYLALAYKMQYVFLVCPPVVMNSSNVKWPLKSQAHSFQECGTVIHCSSMFQHLFSAWYLHDSDSRELRDIAKLYVQDCMENIPEFVSFLDRVLPSSLQDDTSDYSSGSSALSDSPPGCTTDFLEGRRMHSFAKYFSLNDQWQDLAYCVVKIFQGMKSMNDYFKEERVSKKFGKMSKLLISGFVVSPHVVVARIKLSHPQKELWEMPDELDENSCSPLSCASALVAESKKDLPDVSVRHISSKCNQTLTNSGTVVYEPTEAIHPNAKGRSCHIVLGKASNAPSRNVDYDVAFALRRERNARGEDVDIIDLDRCVVKRLGKYWFIYLKEMYVVNALFASCCKPFAYDKAIH